MAQNGQNWIEINRITARKIVDITAHISLNWISALNDLTYGDLGKYEIRMVASAVHFVQRAILHSVTGYT